MKKYSLIYADPCWSYDNKASRAAAEDHYPTLDITALKRLPVWDLVADDAVLAMWWVPPMPLEAIELAQAWGFTVKNMCLFTWAKLNEKALENIDRSLARHQEDVGAVDSLDFLDLLNDQTRMGLGNYTRGNSESCLVATRGRGLERLAANVKQMVYAPLGRHSAKPAEVRYRLDQLYGDVPRIELFAREAAEKWDCWGNEAPNPAVMLRPSGFWSTDDYSPLSHCPECRQFRGHGHVCPANDNNPHRPACLACGDIHPAGLGCPQMQATS